ncbi:MAG: pimeloyl-ACP methyl ester carboxylesterase [Gammaproteobacteria bacterium]
MTGIEEGFIVLDEVRLEYRRFGDNPTDSPTLVFLHEGLGSVAMWKDFPEQLAEVTGFNAFIYSRQSYGKSSPLPLPREVNYSREEAVDVLPKVMEAANILKPVFIGHSDGGSIALIYAGTGMQPVAAGLIVMAPHVFNESVSTSGIQLAKQAYEQGELRSRLSAYHNDVDNAFWRWNNIWLDKDFQYWNIEEFLPGISAPVLHIQGKNDEYGTEAQALAIQTQCGGIVEVLMLADCGHSPFRDQTQATLNGISNFITKHHLAEIG